MYQIRGHIDPARLASTFKTRDLYLGAVLLTLDFPLQGIERKDGIVYWVFKSPNADATEIAERFYGESLPVPDIRKFIRCWKALRRHLFE
jgi:hypothetical protein